MLALALAALSACELNNKADAAKSKAPPAVPVTVAAVVKKTVPLRLAAVGNVEALATVAVKSLVDGQIVKVHFKDGDQLAKGQLLFQVDPRPLEARLRQAQAALAKDEAQLAYARGQMARYDDLLGKKFVSQEAYAQVKANLDAAQAQVKADQAAIGNAQLQLDYATIRAPITGRAGKVLISEGNLVKANDTGALVTINQLSPIYVSFAVPEQHGGAVRERMAAGPVPVEALPRAPGANPVTGRLAFVDNTVDAGTGTLRLRAEFANQDQALWPGDFVEASLILREDADALVVPSRAVQTGPKGSYVFVVKEGKAELRDVTVARSEGAEAVIAAGLAAGEQVVTDGASRLSVGAAVQVKGGGPS